jgi:phage baseplate assembly protein W
MPAGAITASDLSSADWSLMLDSTAGGGFGAGIGNVVQGVADVRQCVKIILTTPKGSDPLRPTFGVDIWKYLDSPIQLARAAIVKEATEGILLWEPRIQVVAITVNPVIDLSPQSGAHVAVTVSWSLKLSKQGLSPGTGAVSQQTIALISNATQR